MKGLHATIADPADTNAILFLPSRAEAFMVFRNEASVAQLDRASDFGSEGYRFKSCRTHHFSSQ